jgi:nucleoside-diphosphate-sugar epimerase
MTRVLVTGARGFVGRELCRQLDARGYTVRRAVRAPGDAPSDGDEVCIGELAGDTRWGEALTDVDLVVHLAARVHRMDGGGADALAAYRRVNTEGTEALARQAAEAGVKRLVFVSSIKVNGEATNGAPFTADGPPRPADPYGRSKWEAEQALWRVAERTGLEGVVVRPPLVYGPGVRANFLALLRLVHRGIPLPLGAVTNRRSLVFVGNLADLLVHALGNSAAADGTFLVSDGRALSTQELVRRLAGALGRTPRLLPVPVPLLRAAGWATGRAAVVERLCGDLVVDDRTTREALGWAPPFGLEEALQTTAAWFRSNVRGLGE